MPGQCRGSAGGRPGRLPLRTAQRRNRFTDRVAPRRPLTTLKKAKDLGDEFMSTTPAGSRSSAARTRRHRERRRQRTRCVTVDVNQSERDALVVRGYLSEEDRDNGADVISDMVFELQSETAERTRRARV